MKALSLVVYIMGILIAFSVAEKAFADPPSPTIKFKGLDAKGCKVFEISDTDKTKKGFISEIAVHDSFDHFDTPTVVPEAPTTGDRFDTVFNYGVDDKPNPDNVTLTICIFKEEESGAFTITAFDSQQKPQKTKVEVDEDKRDILSLSERIPNKKVDCSDPKNIVQTDNLKNPKLECNFDGKDTTISVENLTRINDRLPSTIAIKVDPPSELFLIVVEYCVLVDSERQCPANVAFDLEFQGAEEFIVGGRIAEIDSAALFLAGLQSNTTWIIPVAGLAAGILGFFVTRRFRERIKS